LELVAQGNVNTYVVCVCMLDEYIASQSR